MCELAGVSRASFYRHWTKLEPAAAETELRSAVQRLALAHRRYGYRGIVVLLQREGFAAGAKGVRRLIRKDSLPRSVAAGSSLPPTPITVSRCGRTWPQYLELTDINQL